MSLLISSTPTAIKPVHLPRFEIKNKKFLFGFIDQTKSFLCQRCHNKDEINKYILKEGNHLYVIDNCCAPLKFNNFFKRKCDSQLSKNAIKTLKMNEIVEEDRPENEIHEIFNKIILGYNIDFKYKDIYYIAPFQSIIKCFFNKKLEVEDTIFYLKKAFKKTLSEDEKARLFKINKAIRSNPSISVNSTKTPTQRSSAKRTHGETIPEKKKENENAAKMQTTDTQRIVIERPNETTRKILEEALADPIIRERFDRIFDPHPEVQRVFEEMVDNPNIRKQIDELFGLNEVQLKQEINNMTTIVTSVPLSQQQTQRILDLKNSVYYNFSINSQNYHLLFGFFDYSKQFMCNKCRDSDKTHKYVFIKDNLIFIFDRCIKNHPGEFLKGPMKDTPSNFAIKCLKHNYFIENGRDTKEIKAIYQDITKENVINSSTGMQKKRVQGASAQLVLKRYLDGLLTSDDALFYLQTINKKEKTPVETDQLNKLNKVILLPYKYDDTQEIEKGRKRKVKKYWKDSSSPVKTRKIDDDTQFEDPDLDTKNEIIKTALANPEVTEKLELIFSQHHEIMAQWYQGALN